MRSGWMLLFYQTTPMRVNGSMIWASCTYTASNEQRTVCAITRFIYRVNILCERILRRTEISKVSLISARLNLAKKYMKFKTTIYNAKTQYYLTNFQKKKIHISNKRKYHLTLLKQIAQLVNSVKSFYIFILLHPWNIVRYNLALYLYQIVNYSTSNYRCKYNSNWGIL